MPATATETLIPSIPTIEAEIEATLAHLADLRSLLRVARRAEARRNGQAPAISPPAAAPTTEGRR